MTYIYLHLIQVLVKRKINRIQQRKIAILIFK